MTIPALKRPFLRYRYIASIHQKLDALPVSSTYKSYLHRRKRTCDCYDDVCYSKVSGAKIWTISGAIER
jgi:hypothetical protein